MCKECKKIWVCEVPSSFWYVSAAELKPNSITLASSELAPNMFEAGSCQIPLY